MSWISVPLPLPADRVAVAPRRSPDHLHRHRPGGRPAGRGPPRHPGQRSPDPGVLRATAQHGLRLVTYERGGYGGSDRHVGRSVADAAADVAVILDAIGADVCITEGRSGGGPHTLACAALLPDRVLAVASVAGVAPYSATAAPGWSSTRGSPGWARRTWRSSTRPWRAKPPCRPFLEAQLPGMRSAQRDAVVEALATLLPPVDLKALSGSSRRTP